MTSVNEPQNSKKWADVAENLHNGREEMYGGASGAIFWEKSEISARLSYYTNFLITPRMFQDELPLVLRRKL